jgi:hypothetical protein
MRNNFAHTIAKGLTMFTMIMLASFSAHAIVTVQVGSSYSDAGATASDNYDGDISTRIVTSNAVNTSHLGAYSVTYNVSDNSGNAATPAVRTVKVVDAQKPVITLVGDSNMSVKVGAAFTDPGATASDNYDGDISTKITTTGKVNTSTVGSYLITYNVSDSSSNAATPVVRTVTVSSADTTKPVITLINIAHVKVRWGKTYTDPGATAKDNVDGDISSQIVTSNPVNVWVPGTYTVTYNVKDSAGNAAVTVTRSVQVCLTTKTDEDDNSLYIMSPLTGSTYYATSNLTTLTFTASAPVDAESVEYSLDGVVIGKSSEAPYTVATEIDPTEIGWGEHTVTASATVSTSTTAVTAESTFTLSEVNKAEDSNDNGLADNPFTTLALDGDAWLSSVTVSDANAKRLTGMARFDGVSEASDAPVVMVLSGLGESVVSVNVPRELLNEDETGVAVVQVAQDLNALVGAEEASLLAPEPENVTLVKGGVYVEVTILTSSDNGETFEEVEDSRLASHPVTIEMQGVEPTEGSTLALYKHETFMSSDNLTGLELVAQEGAWNSDGVQTLTTEEDWMHVTLTSLSVMAPYETVVVKETEEETQTTTNAGCAGGSMDSMLARGASGDILILSFALLTLLVGGSKAAVKRARATQRP